MKRILILVAIFTFLAAPAMVQAAEDVNSETMPAQAMTVEATTDEAPTAETAVEEPAAEEAEVEESAADEAVMEESVVEEAVMEGPVAEEAVMEESVVEEAVMEEPVAEEAAMEEPAAEETMMEEAVTEEVAVEEAATPEPETPAGSKEAVTQNLKSVSADIDAIFSSIKDLYAQRKPVEGEEGRLKETYLQFKGGVSRFKRDVEALRSNSDQMVVNMEQTFEKWQVALDAMRSETVKAQGQKRRDSKLETFKSLNIDMWNLQSDLGSYISELNDIESFLAFSLDPEGVSQIGDMLVDTIKIVDKLDIGIEKVTAKVAALPDVIE